MTKIGLISDTHGYLDEAVFTHFKNCDEIWHVGDFGICMPMEQNIILPNIQNLGVWQEEYFSMRLGKKIKFRGVYGNIDGNEIRQYYPEQLFFTCEAVKVFMQHIGGYPGRYCKDVKETIQAKNINLFISGHSHILKIMYDQKINCLHMNPGAAGKQGWHKIKTLIRFTIDGVDMRDCEVIELG